MSLLRAATVAVLVANFFLPASGWADVLITDVIGKPGLVSKPPLAILNEVVNGSLVEAPAGLQFTAIDLVTGKEYLASGPGQFRIASAGVLELPKLLTAFENMLPCIKDAEELFNQLAVDSISLGTLTDVISYALDLDVADKQALLAEQNVDARAKTLVSRLRAAAKDALQTSTSAGFPPAFSAN